MLLEEELRFKTRDGSGDAAFSANAKGKGLESKKKLKKKRFSGSCYYCDKKGHAVKDCRKK